MVRLCACCLSCGTGSSRLHTVATGASLTRPTEATGLRPSRVGIWFGPWKPSCLKQPGETWTWIHGTSSARSTKTRPLQDERPSTLHHRPVEHAGHTSTLQLGIQPGARQHKVCWSCEQQLWRHSSWPKSRHALVSRPGQQAVLVE